MTTTLITGANRGLGLALATRFARRTDARVFAVARDLASSPELRALVDESNGRVRPREADLSDPAAIDALAASLDDVKLDVLINNAAVPSQATFASITPRELRDVFTINTFAPLLLTQALAPRLVDGGKVVNITSTLGSIERARDNDGWAVYGMSKAALNMFTVKLATTLKPRRVAVVSLHPGWVKTRMGGDGATLAIDTSADGMMRVIDDLDMERTGTYLTYAGETLPW